jgi:hypothetical protein
MTKIKEISGFGAFGSSWSNIDHDNNIKVKLNDKTKNQRKFR